MSGIAGWPVGRIYALFRWYHVLAVGVRVVGVAAIVFIWGAVVRDLSGRPAGGMYAMALSLLLVCVLLTVCALYVRVRATRGVWDILYVGLDADKYLSFFEYERTHDHARARRGSVEVGYGLSVAWVAFLRGDFAGSLRILDSIQGRKGARSYAYTSHVRWLQYRFLDDVFLGRFDECVAILAELDGMPVKNRRQYKWKAARVGICHALYDLVARGVPNDAGSQIAQQSYGGLGEMQSDYYGMLAARAANDTARARLLSGGLAQGDPQFFFVRQAREYLEAQS